MKVLLVNNYQQGNETATFEALKVALSGHDVEVQRYHPGITFNEAAKDLVVLSGGGGEGSEINDRHTSDKLWYEDQMEFILSATKPIVGVCMGFEVVARAYGANVMQMKRYIEGFTKLKSTSSGQHLSKGGYFRQHENHVWRVPDVSTSEFDVLAYSDTGIEMIRHKNRRLIATQFHPEVLGGTVNLNHLIAQVA